MGRLDHRIAVVSGAAAGLGKAAAIRLASEGATLELLDVRDSTSVVEEIRKAGGDAFAHLCDVTSEEQIKNAVAAIASRHDHVDILVNNAGILSGKSPWHELPLEEVNRYLQINYVGYLTL